MPSEIALGLQPSDNLFVIRLTTEIAAPIARCFDLSRSIDLHIRTAYRTGERAVAGRVSGLIEPDEEVTWRGRHLGLTFEMTSRISAMERPTFFQDRMLRGP